MKLLLLPLLLLGVGAGGYGLLGGAKNELPEACDSSDCRVTVECTEHNTCIVTCFDANGDVRCQKEIECDEVCEKVCDKPCDKPCEAPSSCSKR